MERGMVSDGRQPTVLLVTEPRMKRFADPAGSPLEGCGDLRRVDWLESMDDEERFQLFDAALADADAVVVGPWTMAMPPFTAERWAKASRLKTIAGTFDNRFGHWLDVADAFRRGVTIIDTSRSMTPTVAEFALAMTLNLLRDIPAAIQLVRQGAWKTDHWDQPGYVYGDLTGRRVGLAGYGSINRRYAELLGPFRWSLATYDPFVADSDLEEAGIQRVDALSELAAESEIFVVGIPPTPATQQIISREVIDALPTGANVIIVTRMAVIDQEALWRRAEAGEIRAAVDVFAPEPPPADASFRMSPFVLPTPHIAGDTAYCHRRCFTTACADALAVLAGRSPVYPVTVADDTLYRGMAEHVAG
jgi:phosphoglycerate dehydrogenase-like enzyme